MTDIDNDLNISFSPGLWFYWYEQKPGEEHSWYWGQLSESMDRLIFTSREFTAVKRVRDVDWALQRLTYHMENYLIRIYELRERLVKLFAVYVGYQGKLHLLKGKKTRINTVSKLSNINRKTSDTYLEILSLIDDDIDLRNQNTHDTFLCLGLATEHSIHDPHVALSEIENLFHSKYIDFKNHIRKEIEKTINRYTEKIKRINSLTMKALDQMDFKNRNSSGLE
jgi:hypothetical protein